MTTGLIIGKFMPPHAGHQCLIDAALQHVGTLHIILFSKTAEALPGALRAAWLRELYPQVRLHHLHLDHVVNFDDEAAWDYWIGAIRSVLPTGPDSVFTSEPYGGELARRLGARHVRVDAARARVPISATQIRSRPLAHWAYLPAPVRAHYARRVCVVGAESTGKTTLAAALAEHFGTVFVPEFARDYLSTKGRAVTPADMVAIAQGQAAAEDRLARQANRLLITDTNLLTTQLWHERYLGPAPEALQRLAVERTAHLYFVGGLDVPWVPDDLRDSPHLRQWFHERFCQELSAQGLPFIVLNGSHAERLAQAIPAIDRLLAA